MLQGLLDRPSAVSALALAMVFTAPLANAALPPDARAQRSSSEMVDALKAREQATDVVRLRVDDYDSSRPRGASLTGWLTDRCLAEWDAEVAGTVIEVVRGDMTVGDELSVSWEGADMVCPGPTQTNPPDVEPDDELMLYLVCSGGDCELTGPGSLGRWTFLDDEGVRGLMASSQREMLEFRGEAEVCERLRMAQAGAAESQRYDIQVQDVESQQQGMITDVTANIRFRPAATDGKFDAGILRYQHLDGAQLPGVIAEWPIVAEGEEYSLSMRCRDFRSCDLPMAEWSWAGEGALERAVIGEACDQ